MDTKPRPLSVKEPGARELTGLGRTQLLKLTYAGLIPSYKVGRSRLWSVAGLEQWVADQVAAAAAGEEAAGRQ